MKGSTNNWDTHDVRSIRSTCWLQIFDSPLNLGVGGTGWIHPTNHGGVQGSVRYRELGSTSAIDGGSSGGFHESSSKVVQAVSEVLEEIANHEGQSEGWLTSAQVDQIARNAEVDLGPYVMRVVLSVPSDLLIDEFQVMFGPSDLSFDSLGERIQDKGAHQVERSYLADEVLRDAVLSSHTSPRRWGLVRP